MEDNLLNESEIEINNSIFSRDSLLKETNYNNDFEIFLNNYFYKDFDYLIPPPIRINFLCFWENFFS